MEVSAETADLVVKEGVQLSEQAIRLLGAGRFALFLPGEPHKPSCRTPGCDRLRKAVVKIEML